MPAADQIEILHRAVRYLLAVERVQGKWREHNFTSAQKSQLKERAATEKAATESALLKLYGEVWLPASNIQKLTLDTVSLGGRPLQTTLDERKRALIHQRLMELLTSVQRPVFGTVAPGKIVELFKLGEPGTKKLGIATNTVLAGFYEFLGFPRLVSAEAVRKAIVRGVETGLFGYVTGRPLIDDSGRFQIDRSRVAFERSVADDEIDLDSGFLILPPALPEKPATTGGQSTESDGDAKERGPFDDGSGPQHGDGPKYEPSLPDTSGGREIALRFTADQSNLYAAWNAIANLADVAGEVSINAKATPPEGYDKSKLENGVLEPLRELGLIEDTAE